MSDTDNLDTDTRGLKVRFLGFRERCPDCDVAVGEAHIHDEYGSGCDIARCQATGLQRLICDTDHDCGREVWTGWWPGLLDCERLGWMHGPGSPDLRRLYTEATWDIDQHAWVPRHPPDEAGPGDRVRSPGGDRA
ncbi:hypothetical protein [Actinokineospora sp. HUAS TT18]|uniref:hypothetical protein n=1 Tax=Actinokineospora sp. HUAS TT18 TaxID=3447451 RepID=UPI003F5228F1